MIMDSQLIKPISEVLDIRDGVTTNSDIELASILTDIWKNRESVIFNKKLKELKDLSKV